jgi:hypothetical protein
MRREVPCDNKQKGGPGLYKTKVGGHLKFEIALGSWTNHGATPHFPPSW